MTDTLNNLKNRESENSSPKRYSISGGTAAFLIFNVLLIMGFCKFSFYVLKNHRSLIERDSLVKTYVDVQPYTAKGRESSASLALNVQNRAAPAPFFAKEEKTTQTALKETAPLPVLDQPIISPALPRIANPVSRPPVIRPAIQEAAVQKSDFPIIKNEKEAVPLDTLMASGLNLLNESEKTIVASEILLQEEILPEQKKSVEESNASEELPVMKEPAPIQKRQTAQKKNDNRETRWIDVAELRRQLSDSAQSATSKQDEINRQNTALLNMNNARQVAAVETNIVSDIQPKNETGSVPAANLAGKEKQAPQKSAGKEEKIPAPVKTAVVQDIPFAGTAQAPETYQKAAVVQDIPFAGTAQTPETPQKTDSVSPSAEHMALAGNSPSLWKVAKIKGKTKNAPAKSETKETENVAATVPPASETAEIAQTDVIYRNGRPVQLQETKSLNWMDRQEAAVWTSMSQSDAPSVWSSAAEANTAASSDRAKAFRVADEQPAGKENIVNSAPVRIVGEEVKPESKGKPLLLPLGNTSNVPASAPLNKSFQPLPNASEASMAFPQSPSSGEQPAPEQKAQGQDGIMNKLFSFFGKNDAQDNGMPSIGSGTPVSKETEGTEAPKQPLSVPSPLTVQKIPVAQTNETTGKKKEKQIVPTELRLTFKPNSTEMSSQSIKWIKAFGQKAKKDIQNAVEVRMSNTDPVLQNKRFAMIRNTLIGTGLEDIQIVPIATDRTPHTIVLRMIVLPEEGYAEYTTENNGIKEHMYYKQW